MKLETHTFADDGTIPNSALPVLLFQGAVGRDAGAGAYEELSAENGWLGSSADLLVVGAYPNGMRWDLRRGDPAERDEVLANIARVPAPDEDPVRGRDGPLVELWPRLA